MIPLLVALHRQILNTSSRRTVRALALAVFILPSLAAAKTAHVQVGYNNSPNYFDVTSGQLGVTTINAGDTVEWDWVGNDHTVTSGPCCTWDGSFDLGTISVSGPQGQSTGFVASHTFNQAGTFPYFCRVHGSNAGMTGVVRVVGFTTTSPAVVSLGPTATSGAIPLTITGTWNFTGNVALSCANLPANVACNFAPPMVALSPTGESANTSFTVVTNAASTGTYQPAVVASSGGFPDASASFPLTVMPDYALSFSDPVVQVLPGGTGVFNGTATSLGGYTGNVSISGCGPFDPIGGTITCTTSPTLPMQFVNGPNNTPPKPIAFSAAFATNNGSATAPGDYVSTLQTTDSTALPAHQISATVRVVDFAVTAAPGTVSVAAGNPSAQIPLTISTFGQWNPIITLSCSGAAITAGATCNFQPSAVVEPGLNGAASVALVVSTNGAPVGQSTLTVMATTDAPQTARVQVGPLGSKIFKDVSSGTTTTTINVGDTVEWNWGSSNHSTTSGSCDPINGCQTAPGWDSTVQQGSTFAYAVTFTQPETYPYYCLVHGFQNNMVGSVVVNAGPSVATRTQDVTLNITAGSGAVDLGVTVTHSLVPSKPDPAPVGGQVVFDATVANATSGSSVAATLTMTFLSPVSFGASLPTECNLNAQFAFTVVCSFTSSNGSPADFPIPVTVPFARAVSVEAFVASGAAETNPADNGPVTETVQVRPRPLARPGLPALIP